MEMREDEIHGYFLELKSIFLTVLDVYIDVRFNANTVYLCTFHFAKFSLYNNPSFDSKNNFKNVIYGILLSRYSFISIFYLYFLPIPYLLKTCP